MNARVGTSGYNYPEWKGTFYPADLAPAGMLPYYAARFPTVEINSTFYRMPSPKTLTAWAAATPSDFVFALKAPQRITHVARLQQADEPLRRFVDVAGTLGQKLGPLLFQLPPTFKKDATRLGDFLFQLPPGLRCALEFRHPSWFSDDVLELLRAKGAALCVADHDGGSTPAVATADFGYLRLRAAGYSDEALRGWVETLRRVGAGWADAFVFFKHEESGAGPTLARRLRALLDR